MQNVTVNIIVIKFYKKIIIILKIEKRTKWLNWIEKKKYFWKTKAP